LGCPNDLWPGKAKSEASSLSSGEVSRLWEEPTEAISRKRVAVGIAATYGGEDVNNPLYQRLAYSPCLQAQGYKPTILLALNCSVLHIFSLSIVGLAITKLAQVDARCIRQLVASGYVETLNHRGQDVSLAIARNLG